MKKKLFAFEELAEVQVSIAPDEFAQSDADCEAVEQMGRDVVLGMDASQDATAAALAITEITEHTRMAAETDGVTEGGARALEIAVEHFSRMLGNTKPVAGLKVALEGYATSTNRKRAINLALESIGDFVKQVWEKIVMYLKMAAKWVMDFIDRLLLSNDGLLKRAEKLKEAIHKFKGSQSSTGEKIKSARLAKFLQTPYGFAMGADFNHALTNHISLLKNIYTKTQSIGDEGLAILDKVFKDPLNMSSSFSAMFGGKREPGNKEMMNELMRPFFITSGTNATDKKEILARYDSKYIVNEYPLVFNGTSLFVVLLNGNYRPEGGKWNPADLYKVTTFVENNKITAATDEIETLSVEHASRALDEIISASKNLNVFTSKAKETGKTLDGLAKKCEAELRAYITLNASVMNMIYVLSKTVSTFVQSSVKNIQLYDLRVVKQSLDYVQASIALTTDIIGTIKEVHSTDTQLSYSK